MIVHQRESRRALGMVGPPNSEFKIAVVVQPFTTASESDLTLDVHVMNALTPLPVGGSMAWTVCWTKSMRTSAFCLVF